jgi:hypothetical protein
MKTTLRQLLEFHSFNWEEGAVIVPGGKGAQNVLLPTNSQVLDRSFNLDLEDKDSGTPIFTAEDPTAMYFLCHVPHEKASFFQKVLLEDIEGLSLGNLRGYPYGPKNHGIDVKFQKPLEIFITKMEHSPAFAGCPEIHHYCIGEDRKTVLDIFMMRILIGYMNCRNDSDGVKEEGYVKVLKRLFQELEPKEQVIPPLQTDN